MNCIVLLCFILFLDNSSNRSHIHQTWLHSDVYYRSASEATLTVMGKIDLYETTSKHNKPLTMDVMDVHIVLGCIVFSF